MRLFKGFLIALAGLFFLITILSLLMPSRVTTARSLVINASLNKISEQVFDIKNWKNWHPIFMNNHDILISSPSVGVEAYAEWITNNKKNRMLITEVTPSMVRASWKRSGEKDIENIISFVRINNGLGIQVEWRTLTHLKWFPWEKFAGIFVDRITGPGYEAALKNLQEFSESR